MAQQPPQPPSDRDNDRNTDRDSDPFRPPAVPCEVHCLHCGETYESWQIEWRDLPDESPLGGTWCCPTPDCDGIGFGFDIFPTDPDWVDEDGERRFTTVEHDETDDDAFEDEPAADPDALWVDRDKSRPRSIGNTPQPPFDSTHRPIKPFDEDDIPF